MEKLITFDKTLFLLIYNSTNQKLTKKFFKFITKLSKPTFIIAYILLLFSISKNSTTYFLLLAIIQPLITIAISKILRKKIGRNRPFAVFPNMNLPFKDDPSFPSNHTSSSFIIAFMFIYISTPLCIVMLILAFLVSVSRIITGLHFPLDVFFAILISLSIFSIFYYFN